MKKLFFAALALALIGAGCAKVPTANPAMPENGTLNAPASDSAMEETNTNEPAMADKDTVDSDVDALIKASDDEKANINAEDASDLTAPDAADLDSMGGAANDY